MKTDIINSLGRIYFAGEAYGNAVIEKDTIVVNEELNESKSPYSINNTIIHECVHWRYHYKALSLAKISKQEVKCLNWIEWQASTLTPKIQMPKDMFIQKANELIENYKKAHREGLRFEYVLEKRKPSSEPMFCDYIESVIMDLSDFFKVSKLSAKIRMFELGYDVLGTFIYLDGRYVSPHQYKQTKNEITYSISMKEAANEIIRNPKLQEMVMQGKFVYIDSHLVYNSTEYISDGFLTPYARYNIDKCAIPFTLKLSNKSSNPINSSFYFLNRDKHTPYDFTPTFENELTIEEENQHISKSMEDYKALYKRLSNDFTDSMRICLDWAGKTQKGVADEIGLNEKTIGEIINGKRTPNIKSICMLCLALGLPYMVSEYLIRLSGNQLKMVDEEHQILLLALTTMYSLPFAEIRKRLKGLKVKKI